jgi:hypothetical protein
LSVLKPLTTRNGLAVLLLAAFAATLIGTASVRADPIGGPGGPAGVYAFPEESCTGKKSDPVGVLFRGRHAGPTNVSRFITAETWAWGGREFGNGHSMIGWHFTENDHRQALEVHEPNGQYECGLTNAQNAEASEIEPASRFHIRLWYVPASAGSGEAETVGTPHHEDWVAHNPFNNHCSGALGVGNHAVDEGGVNQGKESGFDQGRHRLRESFEVGGHKIETEMWGNTVEFEQCDEDFAGSDGHGITIWVNNSLHPHTSKASSVAKTSATLNGSLETEESSEYWFGYGTSPSRGVSGYPNSTPIRTTSGPAELNVSQAISGIAPNETYYVRLFARNAQGEVEEGEEVQYSTCSSSGLDEEDDSGGPRVSAQCSGAVDTFYRDNEGNLGHQWWTPGSGWATETRPAAIAAGAIPRVVSQSNGTGAVDVFYRDKEGNLGHQWWTPDGWQVETRPASMVSDPYVVSQASGIVDVFYREPSGNLGHQWWSPSNGWQTESRPASMASDPHVVVLPSGTVNIFYKDVNGNLGHQWWSSSHGWEVETRPASMASEPHVAVQPSGNGVVDVFYRDVNGNLGHQWFNPSVGWATETRPASIAPSSAPRVVEQASGVVDVFYRDVNGNLGHQWFNPGNGWATETRPASMTSDPRVLTQPSGNGVVDIFYRDVNGNLGHQWFFPGVGWSSETRGASMASESQVVTDPNGDGGVNVFYRDVNGNLGHQWWSLANGWATETRPASIAAKPPVLGTSSATAVTSATATLSGSVNPESSPTSYYFEYGTSTAYGSKMPTAATTVGSGNGATPVSQNLTGLVEGTTYHYRLVAMSPEGTSTGEDMTFETPAAPGGAALGGMATTDPFNGTASFVSNFASWPALGWATGASPKGEDRTSGWGSASAYPTENGANYPAVLTDSGVGIAGVATMAANPGGIARYFSLWLDMPTPGAARAGYELRFTYTATNTYTVTLSKWQAGTQTVLATQSNYSFVNGNSFALSDQGSTVSAWTNIGSGFQRLLSAGDSSFSGGNAGMEAAGNGTHLTNFKVGSMLPPVSAMDAALSGLTLNSALGGSESTLSEGGAWSALNWDNSTAGFNTGKVEGGWAPRDAYPTVNGAFWQKGGFVDTGSGDAVSALLASSPANVSRYFSLWLDMPTPTSEHSGYEARFTDTSSNVYEVTLSKWQAGTKTVLATKAEFPLSTGSSFALADKGGVVSIWTKAGAEYSQLLSAADSTFASGYSGLEGSGNITRLKEFKGGALAPF